MTAESETMGTVTIRPENYGKEAVLQLIESRTILKNAKREREKFLSNLEIEKEKALKIAYNNGLLLGAEKANRTLQNSTNINKLLKAKIEDVIIDITKHVLLELVKEDINDILKNTISLRIKKELEAYSKQVNLEDTKISLEISNEIDESEIEKIQDAFSFLHISKKDELQPNTFILRSPYGEIESDPIAFIELVSSHLRNSLDLSLSDLINE